MLFDLSDTLISGDFGEGHSLLFPFFPPPSSVLFVLILLPPDERPL